MIPPISIVIVNYNRERYLGDAIASVLQQTHANFELLIWDDGSTDQSLTIAQTICSTRIAEFRLVAAAIRG
ncbi:MAG: glycosyltransferase [Leptolyngbyaceae cyanobacterium SU_3_3]|nr:glycosyltransferase [Leptolyngbyaceae cyanobacterium SU_3_3]